ncbi:MAG: tetratricopeptide repeat protein [Anaerolineales bacterium]|nr:tetratricopeptide repeat protein [Anaerolineales bacterium]MCB9127853.1 tetratricopeptide repeat protein [Ardenticatenales bacterium]MCB9172963.1 tetratricopeptide repeat protein [Ardenticatenales bacterium]
MNNSTPLPPAPLYGLDLGRLRERLSALGGPRPETATPAPRKDAALHTVLGGAERGECVVVQREYAASHCHGPLPLQRLWQRSGRAFATLGKDPALADFDFRRTLFIDTETNGLAGGAGTYAFLVGIAFWEGDRFVVEQFFMRHPSTERALLEQLAPSLDRFDSFVSFNGKSFDLSVLETRFILNRQPRALKGRLHLDLLHPARRLWSMRLNSCRLGILEQRILGLARSEQDVPGYEIPLIYNDFLRTGRVEALKRILYHNHQDLLALAALAAHMLDCVDAPDDRIGPFGQDLFSLGRLHDDEGERDAAERLYRQALRAPLAAPHRREVVRRLARLLKRAARWEEAVPLWRTLVREGQFDGYEELAKYYEHQVREIATALKVVDTALARLPLSAEQRDALNYRRSRLVLKAARHGEPCEANEATQ